MLEALARPPIRRAAVRGALPTSSPQPEISSFAEADLVAALKALEGGLSERQAIEAIERAAKRGVAPERLRVAAASVAVQRAELDRLRGEMNDGLTLALCNPELRQLLEDVQREFTSGVVKR